MSCDHLIGQVAFSSFVFRTLTTYLAYMNIDANVDLRGFVHVVTNYLKGVRN